MSIYCSVSLLIVLPVFSHADTPHPRLNSAVVLTQCQPTTPFQVFWGDFCKFSLEGLFGLLSRRVAETVDASKAQPKREARFSWKQERNCWINEAPGRADVARSFLKCRVVQERCWFSKKKKKKGFRLRSRDTTRLLERAGFHLNSATQTVLRCFWKTDKVAL